MLINMIELDAKQGEILALAYFLADFREYFLNIKSQ